ncbi:MAG TPA: GNAT family N-acetyltransferase [Spirochaetia bacterium]|nr:GNAT family N-acetyltransferase [Spirochaetia bacterium]
MIIRSAHVGDEEGLARAYVDTWKAAYRGLLRQTVLDALTYEGVTIQWVRTLEQSDTITFLAQDELQRIVGFITAGKVGGGATGFSSEVYTLYVLPSHQRHGTGRRLLRAATDALASAGHRSLIIWVLKGNPAGAFYRKMGGVQVAEKTTQLANDLYGEIAFGWLDISTVGQDPSSVSHARSE